jgi:hypothetical protein
MLSGSLRRVARRVTADDSRIAQRKSLEGSLKILQNFSIQK